MEVGEKLWEQIAVVCPIVGYLIFFKVPRLPTQLPVFASFPNPPARLSLPYIDFGNHFSGRWRFWECR